MNKKRSADNYLTHENWDEEEKDNTETNQGEFTKASEEVIKTRVIKKARRKTALDTSSTGDANPFQSFSFNSNANIEPSTNSFFSFKTNSAAPVFSKQPSTSFSNSTTTSKTTLSSTTSKTTLSSTTSTTTLSSTTSTTTLSSTTTSTQQFNATTSKNPTLITKPLLSNKVTFTSKTTSETSSTFKEEICRLNQEVMDWIKTHFEENPFCIFTPVFEDYNNYVEELSGQKKHEGDNEDEHKSCDVNGGCGGSGGGGSGGSSSGGSGGGSGGGEKEECVEVPTHDEDKTQEEHSKHIFSFQKLPTATSTPKATLTTTTSTTATSTTSNEAKASPFKFGFKPSGQGISTFGSKPGSQPSLFGSKPLDQPSSFGSKPSDQPSLFGSKPSDQPSLFGSKPSNQPSLFGSKPSDQPSLFGSKPSDQPSLFGSKPSLFSSTSKAPSMFSQVFSNNNTTATTSTGGDEDAEYVPPKVESVENKEEGAFYTVKCKLYYKVEDKYEDKGVGFLHLKPNHNKTQLIIRTDTALGNILLNVNLEKNMPIATQGRNNVSMVCVPNPPLDAKNPSNKPLCALIRVKDKCHAEELHKQLKQCQEAM